MILQKNTFNRSKVQNFHLTQDEKIINFVKNLLI